MIWALIRPGVEYMDCHSLGHHWVTDFRVLIPNSDGLRVCHACGRLEKRFSMELIHDGIGLRLDCPCWVSGKFEQVPCPLHDGHCHYPLGAYEEQQGRTVMSKVPCVTDWIAC